MSYIVGRWFRPDGEPKFTAWSGDEPGKMYELMRDWITTGATVEILDYVPNEPVASTCAGRVYNWDDHFNKQERHA
jgi:hypothetical protein